jgi:hypothetical protein
MFVYFNDKIVNADTIDYISCQAWDLFSLRVQFKNGKSELVENVVEAIVLMVLLNPLSFVLLGLGKCKAVKDSD